MAIRLRAQKISIDAPRSAADPWVHVIVQRVELDAEGNEINVVDRWGTLSKSLPAAYEEIHSFVEPCPNVPEGQISGAAVGEAIKNFTAHWIASQYNGVIQPNGDVHLQEV